MRDRLDPNFRFTSPADLPVGINPMTWATALRWAVVTLVVLIVVFGLGRMAFAGTVRQAVVNDPASARAADVKPLIADDLQTYLDGGKAALGWSMHRVTSDKLASDMRTNELAARRTYSESDVVITGTVHRVGVSLETPRVDLSGFVSAFVKGHDDWLATLKPGQRVTIACQRVRIVLGMVGAYECAPRAAYVQRMVNSYFYSMHGLAQRGDKMAAKLLEIASR